MGEAKRRKEAGNTEPNPKCKKNKKLTNKEIQQMSNDFLRDFFLGKVNTQKHHMDVQGVIAVPSNLPHDQISTIMNSGRQQTMERHGEDEVSK